MAAADDLDRGGRGKARARDGVAKGADVFLADLRVVSVVNQGREPREMYAAEEMADEDDEHPLCGVRVAVQTLEGTGGAVNGQDGDIGRVAQVSCGGLVVGSWEQKVASGVHVIVRDQGSVGRIGDGLGFLHHWPYCERRRDGVSRGIKGRILFGNLTGSQFTGGQLACKNAIVKS